MKSPTPSQKTKKQQQQERLAKALRENLHRRKQQARHAKNKAQPVPSMPS